MLCVYACLGSPMGSEVVRYGAPGRSCCCTGVDARLGSAAVAPVNADRGSRPMPRSVDARCRTRRVATYHRGDGRAWRLWPARRHRRCFEPTARMYRHAAGRMTRPPGITTEPATVGRLRRDSPRHGVGPGSDGRCRRTTVVPVDNPGEVRRPRSRHHRHVPVLSRRRRVVCVKPERSDGLRRSPYGDGQADHVAVMDDAFPPDGWRPRWHPQAAPRTPRQAECTRYD